MWLHSQPKGTTNAMTIARKNTGRSESPGVTLTNKPPRHGPFIRDPWSNSRKRKLWSTRDAYRPSSDRRDRLEENRIEGNEFLQDRMWGIWTVAASKKNRAPFLQCDGYSRRWRARLAFHIHAKPSNNFHRGENRAWEARLILSASTERGNPSASSARRGNVLVGGHTWLARGVFSARVGPGGASYSLAFR